MDLRLPNLAYTTLTLKSCFFYVFVIRIMYKFMFRIMKKNIKLLTDVTTSFIVIAYKIICINLEAISGNYKAKIPCVIKIELVFVNVIYMFVIF